MIQCRSRSEWLIPESIEGLAKLQQDYLDATAAVDDGFKSINNAAEDIHVDRAMLKKVGSYLLKYSNPVLIDVINIFKRHSEGLCNGGTKLGNGGQMSWVHRREMT